MVALAFQQLVEKSLYGSILLQKIIKEGTETRNLHGGVEMKRLTVILCVFLIVGFASSCSCGYDNDYFLETNWNCDNETFLSYYNSLYLDKLQELKEKYNVECKRKTELDHMQYGGVNMCYYFYNESFTLRLELSSDNTLATISSYLYYYGNETPSNEYSDFKNLVDFSNDFINYVSYDAKTDANHFEKLFFEALNDDDLFASENLHHDDTVGTLGYIVQLNSTTGGYYYMMDKNNSLKKENHRFEFQGLLKPIE